MTKSILITSVFALGVLATGCDDSVAAKAGTGGDAGPKGDGEASYVKGCAYPDAATYDPKFTPSDFTATGNNKYFPLVPGTTFHSVDGSGNTNDFEITSETKVILGVTCLVIHDVAKASTGELIEDTQDWMAPHKDGSVWYFGEKTAEYQNGQVVSTHGTWTAGVDCAKPGILMEADPKVNDNYREEYYAGEAEDQATVMSLTETVTVPYNTGDASSGTYTNCLMTKNYTDLEPGNVEQKVYCPGIGEMKSWEVKATGGKTEVLTSITHK